MRETPLTELERYLLDRVQALEARNRELEELINKYAVSRREENND